MVSISRSQLHKVLFNECSGTGQVNVSNCFRWFEWERFRIAEDSDVLRVLSRAQDVIFPVTFSECRFYHPIRLNASIRIETTMLIDAGTRLTFRHSIMDADSGVCLAEGKTQTAVVSAQSGKMILNFYRESDENSALNAPDEVKNP